MKYSLIMLVFVSLVQVAVAETVFIEAESFTSTTNGWRVVKNSQTKSASHMQTLNGATGENRGVARKKITIHKPGKYRVWVRYLHHQTRRGEFRLAILQNEKNIAAKDFDIHPLKATKNWAYVWDYVGADLPAMTVGLELSKFKQSNCSSYVRHIDCVLLTTDHQLKPDHTPYGPQTFLRVTLADIYETPVYVHVFADHYRSPWYQHFHLSKAGTNPGLRPDKSDLIQSGQQTPWCNITPMLYQDSGAILNITIRHTYHQHASRLNAKLEFATAANDKAIVRTMNVDCKPNGLVVVMPPDLTTAEHISQLKRDKEFAYATGKIADAYDWPKVGKLPQQFPFFVAASVEGYGTPVDKAVSNREWKTLDYFGFWNRKKMHIGGLWYMKDRSYCRPDIERMEQSALLRVDEFHKNGKSVDDITFCRLMDEPSGQPSTFAAKDEAYHVAFRAWLKNMGKSPNDLLVSNWSAVRPMPESQRDEFPALHYFTQRFRTRALGDFMAVQRTILEKAYDRKLPTLVNFSDGATYAANFYSQGVDYFELLDADDQNAIWGEDWANAASSYQCGAYNVDLMRAAARERKQTIGHFLIAHAGRKPWDIKLKAASETARGVRIWENYLYGTWGSHSGGQPWKSHLWYAKPETWRANAEIVREIGGAEDLLMSAVAKPADVAILYSSSSDVWALKRNYAFGFNRMHTWMALAHSQIPVDFLGEHQVERGGLENYKVCYLSGPNLTREAAHKLSGWVQDGGVLYLSAGAAGRDEFNQKLNTFDSLLPAKRGSLETLQPYLNSGSYVHILQAKDKVSSEGVELEVLSVRQQQTPRKEAKVLAKFQDGTAAIVCAKVGKGTIYSAGFLPALDYIKQAVVARRQLLAAKTSADEEAVNRESVPTPEVNLPQQQPEKQLMNVLLERSYNPWEYSAAVRKMILQPVNAAKVEPPLTCNVPLVDALLLHAENGAVIPLANYTLTPLNEVKFRLRTTHSVARIESVQQGEIVFETDELKTEKNSIVKFSLPLDASDYIKVYYR